MARRVLTAVIWLPIAVVVLAFAPIWGVAIAVSLMAVIAVYELLWATGFVQEKRLCIYGGIAAAFIPLWTCFQGDAHLLLAAVLLLVIACFLDAMIHQKEIKFEMITIVLFGAVLIPYFMSAFLRMELSVGTRLIFAMPLLYAFCSDIGGYFGGYFFGKHKLVPKLSPKKTVEGGIGAIVFAMLGGLAFAWTAAQFGVGEAEHYLTLALLGIPMSITAQFGDLVFSYIKRQSGIKDYGNLFAGHGGVLDRFDSVIFVTPTLELLLYVIQYF